ncbi:hypothetical protein [Flavobacterium aciduliphilum]|uniref:hypothetical protein n=1 Tax=Flavobacterium aciduliphilum TaxID=1101402 RepID=UPI0011BE672A|nr:hypothetical protein [Flavobacterium aciduliphilum]
MLLLLAPFVNSYSQDPGFGDEGGGDAQDAPVAPIANHVNEGMMVGVFIAGYFLYLRKRKTA